MKNIIQAINNQLKKTNRQLSPQGLGFDSSSGASFHIHRNLLTIIIGLIHSLQSCVVNLLCYLRQLKIRR